MLNFFALKHKENKSYVFALQSAKLRHFVTLILNSIGGNQYVRLKTKSGLRYIKVESKQERRVEERNLTTDVAL